MNRWHFPQRDRGLPVAARGEKDTSINSSMPESKQCGRVASCWPASRCKQAGWKGGHHRREWICEGVPPALRVVGSQVHNGKSRAAAPSVR